MATSPFLLLEGFLNLIKSYPGIRKLSSSSVMLELRYVSDMHKMSSNHLNTNDKYITTERKPSWDLDFF